MLQTCCSIRAAHHPCCRRRYSLTDVADVVASAVATRPLSRERRRCRFATIVALPSPHRVTAAAA
jgi:hypothetical protein